MNSKKIISAILAGACTLSMASITSFAADVTTKMTAAGTHDLTTDAEYNVPLIDVTLPTSIKAVINPYQIVIDISSGVQTGTEGITSPEYSIVNNSATFGIKVGAKLTAKGTGIAVAATPAEIPTEEDSEKAAFAYLNTTVGKEADTKGTYASDAYTGKVEDGQLAFAEDKPDKATVLMALEEKTKNNKGFFKVQGEVTDPEIVEKPYATTDKLNLGIIFEVNPYNAGGSGGGFTAAVANTAIDFSGNAAYTLGDLTADDTYALTIDSSNAAAATAFKPALAGYTITNVEVTNATIVTVNNTVGMNMGKLTPNNAGDCVVTYTLTDDSDSSTVTLKFAITVE